MADHRRSGLLHHDFFRQSRQKGQQVAGLTFWATQNGAETGAIFFLEVKKTKRHYKEVDKNTALNMFPFALVLVSIVFIDNNRRVEVAIMTEKKVLAIIMSVCQIWLNEEQNKRL